MSSGKVSRGKDKIQETKKEPENFSEGKNNTKKDTEKNNS